jgi:hypothetical protein
MNRTINFGYHSFGYNTLVKLNMNLTAIDANEIREKYAFSVMWCHSSKNPDLYRIEGIIPWNSAGSSLYAGWFNQLEIYKVNAKMQRLADRKANLLDRAIGAENLIANLNDLPF